MYITTGTHSSYYLEKVMDAIINETMKEKIKENSD